MLFSCKLNSEFTCVARGARESIFPRCSFCTWIAIFAGNASITWRASWANGANWTRNYAWCTGITIFTWGTRCSIVSSISLWARTTRVAVCSGFTSRSLRSLRSSWANGTRAAI